MVKQVQDSQLKAASRALAQADPILARVIRQVGAIDSAGRWTRTNFEALVSIIIGQQLSGKAARTIFLRVRKLCGGAVSVGKLAVLSDEGIRSAGISRPKLRALRALQAAVESGSLNLRRVSRMPDNDAFAALTAITGIGPWTAQIYLMFVLRRPDLFPSGDLGLQKAISENYGIDRNPVEMAKLAEKWRPYRTYACWYLWRWLNTQVPG